jgi:hypothetical protein
MLRGALVAAPLLVVASTALAAVGNPTVRVADTNPVVVRGVNFGAGERITVQFVIRGGERATRLVRAGERGSFTATSSSLRVTQCDIFNVRALGWRGSRASYVQLPPPCGPAP